jgi:hypothetical protein
MPPIAFAARIASAYDRPPMEKSRTSVGRVVACCVLAFLIATDVARAQATKRLVSMTGVDSGDCTVDPCATIQFATDIATPGDTILVSAGVYDENVSVRTNGLTLLGAGPAVTTIRGGQFGNVINAGIVTDSVATLHVEGFTITDIEGASDGNAGINLNSTTRSGPADWIVRGNIIRDTGSGIALGIASASALIENNLIANNRRYGIFNERHYRVIIRNNTIASNGLIAYREQFGTGDSVFVNNIVAFNGTAATDARHPTGFEAASPHYQIAFNNMFGNAFGNYGQFGGNGTPALPLTPSPGTGEISADPLFRDPATGDYRLAPGSPSIDAGTNDDAPATDLDGTTRPLDGDDDGTPVVDMGAFETRETADSTAPVVSAASLLPAVPPLGGRKFPFLVFGSVTDAGGVDPASGTFSVTDEYGDVEPQGTFRITANGRYFFIVWLEASRRGSDRDGRQYLITVTAEDLAGNVGIASTTVRIRHDRRGR